MQSTVGFSGPLNTILYLFKVLALTALFVVESSAAKQCTPDSNSEYEKAYCAIKASRHGLALPELADFRRNAEEVQYLMLKRPAHLMGIDLAKPLKNQSSFSSRPSMTGAEPKGNGKKSPVKRDASELGIKNELAIVEESSNANSSGCEYAVESITCSNKYYKLQLNKINSQLPDVALAAGNKLVFLSRSEFSSDQAFLLDSYTRYIEKMLSIGLAGSTYSYSAFAHLYAENLRQGVNFSKRFAETFELLKRDKRTLGVSRRRPARAPLATDCEQLNANLLVCRTQAMNLVYWR